MMSQLSKQQQCECSKVPWSLNSEAPCKTISEFQATYYTASMAQKLLIGKFQEHRDIIGSVSAIARV